MFGVSRRGVLCGQTVDRVFGPPKAASDSTILNNDIILHYKGDRIIGITVPSFRKRLK